MYLHTLFIALCFSIFSPLFLFPFLRKIFKTNQFCLPESPKFACNINGVCSEEGTTKVRESHSDNVEECLSKCKDEPDCFWSTYVPETKVCQMFSECGHLKNNNDNCPNCITNKKDCDCIVPGGCVGGRFLETKRALNVSECIDLCKNDPHCFYSTFADEPKNTCFKFITCGNIQISTCKNCHTYKKMCAIDP